MLRIELVFKAYVAFLRAVFHCQVGDARLGSEPSSFPAGPAGPQALNAGQTMLEPRRYQSFKIFKGVGSASDVYA